MIEEYLEISFFLQMFTYSKSDAQEGRKIKLLLSHWTKSPLSFLLFSLFIMHCSLFSLPRCTLPLHIPAAKLSYCLSSL